MSRTRRSAPPPSPGRSTRSRHGKSWLPGLAALTAIALATSAAAALEVAPGTTSPTLEAEGCISASGSPVGDCLEGCISSCVLPDNNAEATLDVSNYVVGKKFVETTVYSEFTVTPSTTGDAVTVDADISYDIAWAGGWTIAGVFTGWNDAQSEITLTLTDRTAGGAVVRSATLNHMDVDGFIGIDIIDVGFGLDQGSVVNSMPARLKRGHTYRLGLKIRCEGKGRVNATVILDYIAGTWGARWNDLKVTVAPDLLEEIEKLKKRVDALEDHTHTYLTGRGEGHNNTEAETSAPILVEDPSEEELETIGALAGGKHPLPLPSVFLRSSPNPSSARAAIRFTLPEALPVTISLYDVGGNLSRTLLSEERPAGPHTIDFDFSGLAPGVYFYRLTAGRFTETRKLTLLR